MHCSAHGRLVVHTLKTAIASFFLLFWLVNVSNAADISRDVRADARTDSFVEIGVGIALERVPIAGYPDADTLSEVDGVDGELGIFLNTRLDWNGLFLELFNESFAVATIGYNAWGNDSVEFDLILTSTLGGFDPAEVQGFESLQERDAAAEGGIRTIVYEGENVIQFEAITDLSSTHDGFSVSWQFGRHWQLRNWATHALFGLRYFSEDMNDHYFGVTEAEANVDNGLLAYKASDGILSSIELGATRPINEDWIFRSTASAYRLPDSIVDSPFVTDRMAWLFGANVVYIF